MKQNRTLCRYASLNSKLTKQNNLSEESQSNIRPRNGTSNIPTNICNILSFSRKNSIDNHKLIFENQRIENHRFHTDTNKRKEDQAQRKEKLKQNRLYTTLYNLKHVHLKTEPTTRQKDRFMRKLGQTVNEDIFKAVGYDFDPKCCQLVFDYITTNTSITKIILDNNPLGDQGILKLSQLVHQIDLEELSLVSVGMGNKGAVALFTGLWIKNTIKKLNISSVDCSFKNKISAQGVFNLKQLLNSKSCVLTHLHMDYISLGNQGLKSAFQGVQSSPLQELTLSRNELTSKRMQIFAYGIANTCLSKLDISCNNIGNEGCKYLSEILGSSYGKNRISINLTYLNLASNNINSLGLEVFCRNMCVNQILQTLILDNNLLSQGNRFFHIKYYLTKNWSLKKLSLVNISCNQKDIRFLSQGIQASRSLQQLNLSKNEIDGQSLSNLFMMISRNKSLKRLKLNTCKISDASLLKNQLQITGATYQRIQQIEMQNNYIGNKGGQILKKMANNNVTILRLSLAKNCIGQKILISINQTLKENQRKRPFDTEFKHLQSMANIYEQKKAGLKSEIQRSRDRELFLTKLMIVGDIRNKQIVQQNLNALIKNEKRSIRRIRRKRRGSKFVNNKKTEQNDENSQFLTLISNRSEQMSKVIRRLSPQISIKF